MRHIAFFAGAVALASAMGLVVWPQDTAQASVPGPDITLSCPAAVIQGTGFRCTVGWGANPIPGPVGPWGTYQFVMIYDSPASVPTPGTAMSIVGVSATYDPRTMWESPLGASNGYELCPASWLNASSPLLPSGYVATGVACSGLSGPATQFNRGIFEFFFVASSGALGAYLVHLVTFGVGSGVYGTYTYGAGFVEANNIVCVPSASTPNCSPSALSSPDEPNDSIVTITTPRDHKTDANGDGYSAADENTFADCGGVLSCGSWLAFGTYETKTCKDANAHCGSPGAPADDNVAARIAVPPATGYGCSVTLDITPPLRTVKLAQSDVDLDGAVSILDLSKVASWYGNAINVSSADPRWEGDMDGDGSISILDLSAMASNFGRSVAGNCKIE